MENQAGGNRNEAAGLESGWVAPEFGGTDDACSRTVLTGIIANSLSVPICRQFNPEGTLPSPQAERRNQLQNR